jgi:tetratricopeptide (TPR) repeat protein
MRNKHRIEIFICGVIISWLVVGTYYRNEIWKSPLNLWRDCSVKSPNKARPRNNFAVELIQVGRYEEAIAELKDLLASNPKSPEALNNLATVYTAQGKYDEAMLYLFKAIKGSEAPEFNPTRASAHNNIGVLLVKKGAYKEATIHFKEALKLMPDFPQAIENLTNMEYALWKSSEEGK